MQAPEELPASLRMTLAEGRLHRGDIAGMDAALLAAVGSAVFSFLFYQFWPALPFMDRVGLVFLLCLGLAIVVSLLQGNKAQAGAVELNDISFDTSKGFSLSLVLVVLVLIVFYSVWW